jgi:hypothetical protein
VVHNIKKSTTLSWRGIPEGVMRDRSHQGYEVFSAEMQEPEKGVHLLVGDGLDIK